jgi:hypothetical protein
MLGSISKVRPCGHHHYYKYAHAKTHTDCSRVASGINRNYQKDEYDTVYDFSFHNLTTTSGSWGKGFLSNTKVRKYVVSCPSITNASYFFFGNGPGMNYRLDVELKDFNWEKITNVIAMFCNSSIHEIPSSFKPISKDLTGLTREAFGLFRLSDDGKKYYLYNKYIDEAENLNSICYASGDKAGKWYFDTKYKFENAKNILSWCRNTWPYNGTGLQEFTGFSLKNLEIGQEAFWGCRGLSVFSTTDNMTKLSNAQNMFGGCGNLTSLYPDKTSFSLPSLTNAKNMFGTGDMQTSGSKLDKPSTLKLCNALPTHTDGVEHLITIGIHIDHKYDPEVNVALKKVCKSYTTPIEEAGSSLGTTVSSDKGWTLEIQWNGTATSNAYPAP